MDEYEGFWVNEPRSGIEGRWNGNGWGDGCGTGYGTGWGAGWGDGWWDGDGKSGDPADYIEG